MKKFISAASSMAMVASLVGSAIPFTTVAAEASKTLELRAFVDKDNKAVSTTISAADIAAGDVTIPVGIYYVEKTADTKSIRASFGVSSKDGDASKVLFGYDGVDGEGNPIRVPYNPNAKYFNANQSFTIADGSTVELANLATWAGTMVKSQRGAQFKGTGTYQCSLDTKQNSQNWANAWGSLIWAEPYTGGYAWTGKTSDAFPGFVFDCTFPKGTPAGTYTIDFINMVPDPAFPSVWSTMIESSEGGGVYTTDAGNLTCKGLTITIEGDSSDPKPTEPQPTNPPATTAPPATNPPATNPPATNPPQSGNVQEDFVVTGEKVTYKAGEDTLMNFTVQSNGHLGAMMGFEIADLPAGIKADVDPFCYAFEDMPAWEPLGEQWATKCMDPASQDPRAFTDGEAVVCLMLTVPADIKDGTYDITFDYFHVVEQPHELKGPIVEFDAKVIPGQLIVGNGATDPTEPQPTEPQPSQPAGKVLYGDANDNGKVDIADVVVLNKWLNDNSAYAMTAQGKINADCCDPKAGTPDENDSKAIIQSLVHLNNGKALPWTQADLK